MNEPISPIDLLPIPKPLEDTTEYSPTCFYENVVEPLIPDIIQLEATGIPIDLTKVSALEDTVTNVLEKVYEKLKTNEAMLKFLNVQNESKKKDKATELQSKKKTWEDFKVDYDPKNKTHRTYVVNYYLTCIAERLDLVMEEWSIKDLKILNQVLASNTIQRLLDKDLESLSNVIDPAMQRLAEDKADIYNKSKVDTKIEALQEIDLVRSFNPGSTLQKQEFFKFYGIESENITKKGNPKWDRDSLVSLQRLLNIMLDEKTSREEE